MSDLAQKEAQVLALELEKVDPKLPTLFDWDDVFYSSIESKDVETISGRDMRLPLELRPGGNFGYFNPDGGDMGRGGAISYEKALINTVNLKIGIEWTKKTEWVTDSNRKAIIQNLKRQLAKGMAEFRRQVDSQAMGDGTGVLGIITSFSTSGGKDTYVLNTDGYNTRLFRFGQYVAVYQANLSANRVIVPAAPATLDGIAVDIDLIDPGLKTVRIRGAATAVANGDKLVVNGLSGATPTAMYGVPYHHNAASTGTWLGLDRALIPEIRANQVIAGGALALPFARLALNKIGDRVGLNNKVKAVAWMHHAQKQAYEELGQNVSIIQKQATAEGLNLYFGDNLQLAGANVKCSYSWDKTRIDFIVGETWGRAVMHEASFYTVDGTRIFPLYGTSGGIAAGSIFYITASMNLFVDNPALCSYISGLLIPAGY